MFKPHEERYDRKPNLTSFNKPSPPKQTSKPVSTPSTAKKAPRPAGQQEFIYHDADGHPVIKVRRTDHGDGEKAFSQFRWENGQWVAGLNEQVTKRVRLYRINEARELSKKTGLPIFLVEGESCAERLLELGIPATTSLGGSGKWTKYGYPNYLQDLSSFRVILCPDADFCGMNHMLEVEKSLRAHGIEIIGWLLAPPDAPWDNLPKGGGLDVVDWLENGATVEEILSSIRVSLPAHLVVDDEHADLAEEVSELAQLDRASGITLLPNRLDISLRRLAENLVLPTEAYWLPLLCTAASLISSQTRLMINRYSEFSVPPVLWGGLVGEPGSGKSHILNVLTKPLKDIQAEHFTLYQHRLEEYQAALRDWERRRKNEDAGDMPKRPKPTSLYASNYTLEAIGQTLGNQPDRGLLINPDELAVFLQSMDAYRGGKGADRAHWLSLYNGDALKVDRKNSDQVFVRHTSVSVVGGIQPSVLQNLWREDKNIDDGLWSRFAWVQIPLTPTPYIEEEFLSSPCKLLERVYRRLLELPPQEHELDDEARKLWKKWNQEVDELLLSEPNERIRTTLPKTKERAARIALILHYLDAACAEDKVIPSKVIPASTLARAIEFTRWLHDQTKLLCGELGESATPEAGLAHRFLKRFQGCGSVSLRQARNWWPGRRKPSSSEIRTFLDGVVQLGYARWVDPNHVELLQPCSGSPVVHKETESLAQSDFEQWTTASSTRSPSSSTAVTPADGECSAQPETMDCMPVTPPAADSSRRRKKLPEQTALPLEQTALPLAEPSASSTSAPEEKKTPTAATTNGAPPTKEEDSRISIKEWNSLLDAFDRAGVSNLQRRDVIAEAAGIPRGHVGTVPLTREQYNRALEFIRRWPSRTYAHHQPEPTDAPPEQAVLPLDPSAGGIPPWHWDR
jgi:hypothetical protein